MPPQTPSTICLPCIAYSSLTANETGALWCAAEIIRRNHPLHDSKKPEAQGFGFDGCGARGDRQRPIVPQSCPCSIVGAGGLNDRVRDGNGCAPSAVVTNPPASHISRE